MSPPARAGQALRVRAKTAPVSARKLSALLSPPPKKIIGEAKDDLSDLDSGSGDEGASGEITSKKSRAGANKSNNTEEKTKTDATEGGDTMDAEEPGVEGEVAEPKDEVQEMLKHSDDEELVSTSEDDEYRKGPKKWKKKPINGRRYTSKRKCMTPSKGRTVSVIS